MILEPPHHTTAAMTYDEGYDDAWDEDDEPSEPPEPLEFCDDLWPLHALDRHASLTAAERNPLLR